MVALPGLKHPHSVALSLLLGLLLNSLALPSWAWQAWLNPYGYHPKAPKLIHVQGVPQASGANQAAWAWKKPLTFHIVDPTQNLWPFLPLGKKRLKAPLENQQVMAGRPLLMGTLDLSSLTRPGRYQLRLGKTQPTSPTQLAKALLSSTPNDETSSNGQTHDLNPEGLSQSLLLSEDVYWQQLQPTLRSLYLHRSGVSVEDTLNRSRRYAAHLNDASPNPNAQFKQGIPGPTDLRGGWYDAEPEDQQFTKSTLTNAVVVTRLLHWYGQAPSVNQRLGLQYPLAERAKVDLPDALHEACYALDWLVQMQADDGSFYSQVHSAANVAAGTPPWRDRQLRYYEPSTFKATAAATAALASGSRALQEKDPSRAVRYLRAAQNGWLALENLTPAPVTEVKEEQSSSFSPETQAQAYRFWAAAELALLQRNEGLLEEGVAALKQLPLGPVSASNPSLLGAEALLAEAQRMERPEQAATESRFSSLLKRLKPKLELTLKEAAAPWLALAEAHPRQLPTNTPATPLPVLAERAYLALLAHPLSPPEVEASTQSKRSNKHAAQEPSPKLTPALLSANQLFNWVLGANPWQHVFITGNTPIEGLARVQQPCHALSYRQAIPGLLVNGPLQAYQANAFYADSKYQCKSNAASLMAQGSWLALLGQLNEQLNVRPSLHLQKLGLQNPAGLEGDPNNPAVPQTNRSGQALPRL